MMKSCRILCLAGALAVLAAPACARDYEAGALRIDNPWARATPPGAQVAAGYMAVTNGGHDPDRLLGGASPVAGRVTVHEMKTENGVMQMRPLAGGLEIKPGETVTLAPGGYHLMFEHLKEPLKQGEQVPATLDFAKAGKVQVNFAVEAVGARGPAAQAMQPMPGMAGGDGSRK